METVGTEILTLSGILGVLIFITLYTLLVPRKNVPFKPAKEDDTPAMKFAGVMGTELINSLPADFVEKERDQSKIQELLKKSGNPWRITAREFFFLQFVSAFTGFLIAWGVWFALSLVFTVQWYVLVPLITIGAFFWPRYRHSYIARQRDLEFKRQLPEALDLMKISMSSGNSLPQAIKDVAVEAQDSVLKEEFILMVRKYESGVPIADTLNAFAAAAPSEAIESFVKSIKQADELQVSMVETLEQRSAASRADYIALIEKRIATLSSKMFAVLTPTLIPAMMIIVLAPTLIVILDSLGGGF